MLWCQSDHVIMSKLAFRIPCWYLVWRVWVLKTLCQVRRKPSPLWFPWPCILRQLHSETTCRHHACQGRCSGWPDHHNTPGAGWLHRWWRNWVVWEHRKEWEGDGWAWTPLPRDGCFRRRGGCPPWPLHDAWRLTGGLPVHWRHSSQGVCSGPWERLACHIHLEGWLKNFVKMVHSGIE